ncbi:hypothetical protein KC323_g8702 [Hortaea werneckii]|nr:hypothetical protein KC323_g8702 [Hortaea werneckii]
MTEAASFGLDSSNVIQPSHFNAGIVVASYCASLCGCLLTIEMLHRRGTALNNPQSWLETLGCAISLGLVGIWCMHFIGNRAIVLGDGEPKIQLVYNAGYTALSVFLPIIGLTLAFSAAEFPTNSRPLHWCLLVCTSIFAGFSVVGMHYIGNFGIMNYKLTYAHRFVAGSIIIAIGDCMLVLNMFYTLRERWISSWWKRLLCAMLLAGGVCAMHFTASAGCIYTLRNYDGPHAIQSRNTQAAVAGAFGGVAAATLLGVIIFTRYRAQMLKTRSQKIMLACAMLDPGGRLLVTTEGVLPSREITDKYHHQMPSDEFDTAHPVFQWAFRVTRNWESVVELLPRMKSHILTGGGEDNFKPRPPSFSSSINFDSETYKDYSINFRERFCVAAQTLAAAMHVPVGQIGVLYDKILHTGTLEPEDRAKQKTEQVNKTDDVETGRSPQLFAKGQLMLIVKKLAPDETNKLLNAGFKFGKIQHVGHKIAEAMQIPLSALETHLEGVQHFLETHDKSEKSGTWLSLFCLIPSPNQKGFDVGVKRSLQEQLPDVQLLPRDPQPWQAEFLQRMDGLRTTSCLAVLEGRSFTEQRTSKEQEYAKSVLRAMVELRQQVPGDWFRKARFLGRPVFAHYPNQSGQIVESWVYAFCAIADMHISLETSDNISRTPLTFFGTRQRCYAGSPDHELFAREIRQEFGPFIDSETTRKDTDWRCRSLPPRIGRVLSKTKLWPAGSRTSSIENSEDSSVHELVVKSPQISKSFRANATDPGAKCGGILVNSETVVKSHSRSRYDNTELQRLRPGMEAVISVAKREDTFVDELMKATCSRFRPPKLGTSLFWL